MTRTLKFSAIALLGVMILWACGGSLGPKETGEKFLKALKTGDFDTAKKYATKEAQASLEMMAGMSEGKESGNADDIKVGELEENGDKATLHYTDAGKEMTLELVKEDGDWKANWSKGGPEGGSSNSTPLDDLSNELEDAFDEALTEEEDGTTEEPMEEDMSTEE